MRMRTSLVLSFGLFVSPCAQGGPEWIEQGDAGSDSSGSQTTTGTESLGSIKGTLTLSGASSNTAGAGTLDLEDVYLICIDNPAAFSATTEAIGAGTTAAFAQFDSQLYLRRQRGGRPARGEGSSSVAGSRRRGQNSGWIFCPRGGCCSAPDAPTSRTSLSANGAKASRARATNAFGVPRRAVRIAT